MEEELLVGQDLQKVVDDLIHLAREGDAAGIVRVLDECIPGAVVRSTPTPDMTALV